MGCLKMGIIKNLSPEEYSEARKRAMEELKMENEKRVDGELKTENVKIKSFDVIIKTLGNEKMTRKNLRKESGLTDGQIAGCIYKSKKSDGILKFKDGLFYVER